MKKKRMRKSEHESNGVHNYLITERTSTNTHSHTQNERVKKKKQITARISDLFYHAKEKCVIRWSIFSFSIFVYAIYTWDFIK